MSDEKKNMDFDADMLDTEEFSLESILAEYKGSAYISGDKKTPNDILNAQTERILREASKDIAGLSGDTLGEGPAIDDDFFKDLRGVQPRKTASPTQPVNEPVTPAPVPEISAQPQRAAARDLHGRFEEEIPEEFRFEKKQGAAAVEQDPQVFGFRESEEADGTISAGFSDMDIPTGGYAHENAVEHMADEISRSISTAETEEEDVPRVHRPFFARFSRRQGDMPEDAEEYEEEELFEDEPLADEPPLAEEAARFSAPIRQMSIRTLILFVLGACMLLFTILFEGGHSVPFGIGRNQLVLTGILLLFQLFAMACALDILLQGIQDLFKAEPGVETMAFFSCLTTFLSGFVMLATKSTAQGLPFCLISVFSLFFALRGKVMYYIGMSDSLRTAISSQNTYGIVTEREDMEDRVILKKTSQTIEGFYRNLAQRDIAEYVYSYAVPLLLIAAVVFAVLISFVKGGMSSLLFSLAAMISVATTFSAFAAYPLPFKIAAQKTRSSGCAVAGWGGASEIYDADGALITDGDVFPVGTMSLSGIKLFEGAPQNKVIAYASSVIYAANSGLSKIFAELMRSQSLNMERVEELNCYEGGGVGAVIRGEKVIVGSSGFMNLQGIRVPDSVNEKNALFCAINGELMGVFSVNYIPANSVQSALISMIKTKIGMILAVRDFNVTPMMLQQKFKVSLDEIEYIPQETTYRISDETVPKGCDAVAILCREGLGPFAHIITKGRQLKLASTLMTIVSVVGAVFGLLLMFFLCWNAAYTSASAFNAFKYLFGIHVVVLLLSMIVRRRD